MDETGGSIKVEGKFVTAGIEDESHRCSGESGMAGRRTEQSIEFLDVLVRTRPDTKVRMTSSTRLEKWCF